MKFGIFDVIVFYKFVDEVSQEYVDVILDRLRDNDNVYVCPNSYPELGLVSTDITLYSLTLSVEEIGAVLFGAMDGNVVFGTRKESGKHNIIVDKLKIRYDFEGENSEEYVKALYNYMPNDENNFIHYCDSSLYIWTRFDVEGATDLVLNAIEKMD
nr:MAG TPA: hypothetical protein [Caudoviricetes sp.]